MRSQIFYVAIFMLLHCIPTYSQTEIDSCFLDVNFDRVKATDAVYVGRYYTNSNGYYLATFLKNSKLKTMEGWFLDSTFKNPHGQFAYYDKLGNRTITGKFENGLQTGYWIESGDYGLPFDSTFFENGTPVRKIITRYYLDGSIINRTVTDVVDNSEINQSFYPSGKLQSYGSWKDEKGKHTTYYEDGTVKEIKIEEKGSIILKQYFDPSGKEISEKAYLKQKEKRFNENMENTRENIRAKSPEFPGGAASFQSYLTRNIFFDKSTPFDSKLPEKVTVLFSLDKDGKAVDVMVVDATNPYLVKAIKDAFENMPAWKMKGFKKFGPIRQILNYY